MAGSPYAEMPDFWQAIGKRAMCDQAQEVDRGEEDAVEVDMADAP